MYETNPITKSVKHEPFKTTLYDSRKKMYSLTDDGIILAKILSKPRMKREELKIR